MRHRPRVLFLCLNAFSITGGIEKFGRCFLKALHELNIEDEIDPMAISAYDRAADEKYFHRQRYTGWNGNRFFFIIHSMIASMQSSTLVLAHINLSPIGWLVKRLMPKKRVIMVVHGIEVWKTLSGIKLKMLQECDLIFSVSEFTKGQLLEHNPGLASQKIKIFPNTLDPYFNLPKTFGRPSYLVDRYQINPEEHIVLTVTRLSSAEKYKGYDFAVEAIADARLKNQKIKYLLCGKADEKEHKRMQDRISALGMSDRVYLVGFVAENELTDHYLLGDIFVMPSKREGFGIVFLEALACGLKVIAGSKDGSSEALMHGKLGKLVDPDSLDELVSAIHESVNQPDGGRKELQKKVIDNFGFPVYKERLKQLLLHSQS